DYVPTLPDYSLDFDLDSEPVGDDSSDEDLTEAAKSLHTQTALTPEILLRPSATSPSSPPPSLLPSSSRKRSRSPSPPPLVIVSPPPPLERIVSVKDDVEALRARLASVEQETDYQVTDKLKITVVRSRVEYAETRLKQSHESRRADWLKMAELQSRAHNIEARLWEIERTMPTMEQGMSFAEIEQMIAQRVTNAIEAIAIYETKTQVAHDLIDRVEHQGAKVAKNASNKRKWEGNHYGSSSQQQNKRHKVIMAHAVRPSNKKGYAGTLPIATCVNFTTLSHTL
nr:hypothetical protein [Tanacetum cinerariifolium]